MGLSSDVVVDGKKEVTFPDACVVCGRRAAGEAVRLRANPMGFHQMLPWLWLLRRTRMLVVPAHLVCGRRLRLVIFWRNMSLFVLAMLGVGLAIYFGWTKWQMLILVIAIIAGPTLWQTLRPIAFEFTYASGRHTLMFRDRAYASQVAALNDGAMDDEEDD